ncbi:MAG: 50S ribosomal protein L6 [Planctomycetota bacterium]|nr:MAG: 50S ribosomal protein L6 [Planctomycetota bacterium]
MSRIGKQPITFKDGTKVSFSNHVLKVEAGKATLTQDIDPCVRVEVDDGGRVLTLGRVDDSKRSRAMHGLYRSLAANMVQGVEQGFVKKLEIQGVGYNAKIQGKSLTLNIGFNAPVTLPVPEGLTVETPTPTNVTVSGANKQAVGQYAAEVRAVRKPEPYKGKGIRYEGEIVRRKVGKSLGA